MMARMAKKEKQGFSNPAAANKKAYRDFTLVEKFEAGLELLGSEVKSLRSSAADLSGSYARLEKGECWLVGAKIAPYALNVQVKVVVSGPGGKSVPADFPRLAKILTAAGYRGYIVLEYEENEDPREACPRVFEQLREAFA